MGLFGRKKNHEVEDQGISNKNTPDEVLDTEVVNTDTNEDYDEYSDNSNNSTSDSTLNNNEDHAEMMKIYSDIESRNPEDEDDTPDFGGQFLVDDSDTEEDEKFFAGKTVVTTKKMTLDEYIDDIVNYFTVVNKQSLNSLERSLITKEDFVNEVQTYIKSFPLNDEEKKQVFKSFSSFLWSYDIIDDLIDDPEISDIKVISWDLVRVKRLGKRETSPIKFRSPRHFESFINHVAVKNKISLSDNTALQNFVDKKSNPNFILRFNISTKFINSTEAPYMHIRKVAKNKYTIEQLVQAGMMDEATAKYLMNAAANRDGILFTGKGASGKTTLMNVLLDYIPDAYSGLVIQENEELFSHVHPDLMFQHTVMNRGEGKISYDLQDLARNGLLIDLDYFIIGEIKGGEALYMLNAAYTGHRCWASVHGASSTEAMNKLVDYIKYSSDYTREEAMQMLTHINTVVFLKQFKVREISEIVGWDEENKKLIYKNIPVNIPGETPKPGTGTDSTENNTKDNKEKPTKDVRKSVETK